jgi:uncharacterized protein (TIGR03437 family)
MHTLSPASVAAGGSSFTLTVTGSGFGPSSVVEWNSVPLLTSYTSGASLQADVPSSLIAGGAQSVAVTVTDGKVRSDELAFSVTGDSTAVTLARILNSASMQTPIAPGSLISVVGSNLASGEARASLAPLPTTLGGVSLSINGVPAPLVYVGPDQINAQMPYEAPTGSVALQVMADGRTSASGSFNVSSAAPGLFFTGPGAHAVAQNYPDWSLNSPENPASPGQYVIVYLTGIGPLDHQVETGAPAPVEPLAKATSDVKATLGGKPAEVTYAGVTPGTVGLAQINLLVPDIAAGEQPLEVTVGSAAGNVVNLSVKAK